ncbi:MAG: response regulator [Nitrospirae bacterium]|nr:response regulator [Nitrospirota bacterium]
MAGNTATRAKILIVEDNLTNLELFMDILDNIGGYRCVFTTSGEEAVEIASREKPDLILLDIQLPGMDGLTVGNILKSNDDTKHLKIVALTAHALKGDREMFLEKGFDGYIPKPIKMKEFLDAIENYLGR